MVGRRTDRQTTGRRQEEKTGQAWAICPGQGLISLSHIFGLENTLAFWRNMSLEMGSPPVVGWSEEQAQVMGILPILKGRLSS